MTRSTVDARQSSSAGDARGAVRSLPEPVAASILLSDRLEEALSAKAVIRVPLVRGRAVWAIAAAAASAVIEWPNPLGLWEQRPGLPAVVQVAAGAPDPGWPEAILVRSDAPGVENDGVFRSRSRSAQLLAKHLEQIPGVSAAFGPAAAPTVVIVASGAPGAAVAACRAFAAWGVAADAPAIPGLPGAVRFAVTGDPDDAVLRSVAATFAASTLSGAAA